MSEAINNAGKPQTIRYRDGAGYDLSLIHI